MQAFDNLSTDKSLNSWILESIEECKSTYPMLGKKLPVAVDIGANVGGFCVYAKDNFEKIYAFEPETTNYAVLDKVKDHYKLDNVEIFNTAIYSKSNLKLAMRNYLDNHSKDVTCAQFEHESFSAIDQECETISLHDMMEALGLDRISYLKIDCEGSEYEILENFEDYHKVDIIALELHNFYGQERKVLLLNKLLEHYYFLNICELGSYTIERAIENCLSLEDIKDDHIFLMINKGVEEASR